MKKSFKMLGLEAEAVGRGRRLMDNIDNIGFLLLVLFLFFVMLTNLNFDKFLTSFLFFCFYDRMSDFRMLSLKFLVCCKFEKRK